MALDRFDFSGHSTTRTKETEMRKRIGALALAALVAAGCSDGDTSTAVDDARVVKITMLDNRYEPSEVTVQKGQAVTFEFTNKGTVNHEALVGDEQAQADHAEEMKRSASGGHGDMEGMEHAGAEGVVTVEPGSSDSITTTFDDSGTILIGCHVPLHYEQGMKATVTVT